MIALTVSRLLRVCKELSMADQDVERSSTGSVHSTGGMSLGEMEVVGRAKAWLAAVTASAVHAAYSAANFMTATAS